jgi:hypothetical protein
VTKAELEKALEAAEARIAELEQSGDAAPAAAPLFVQWRTAGPVPGGHVSPMWLSQDPPFAALQSVAHVQVSADDFGRLRSNGCRAFSPWLGAEG